MAILLGGILLDGLEAPAGLRYGGAQALAIHRLPGGARVIDAMGPDDADIIWRGYLSGADAVNRARELDTMRSVGAQTQLAWDGAFYNIVISRLQFVYFNPWWIEYDIRCTVAADPIAGAVTGTASTVAQIATDLASAGTWTDVSAASLAVAAPDATLAGTAANAAAIGSISILFANVQNGVAAADADMTASDVPSLVAAAGRLAGLAAASGYIARAAANLNNAGA